MRRIIAFLYMAIACMAIAPVRAFADGDKFVVVLDPGHGGKDPGAVGSSRSNREKDINLKIALEVGRLLKANCPDVKLIYTRSNDTFVELGRRAEIANKAKADLFVSIHTNAVPKGAKSPVGVQSYTLTLKSASTNLEVERRENSVIKYETSGKYKYGSSEDMIMLELVQDRDLERGVKFAKIVHNEMVAAGRKNMGVLQANLAVLRLTYMPSVLLEVGYISSPTEEKFLLSASGQATMARSIYNGIVKFKAQQTGRRSSVVATEPDPEPVSDETQTEAVEEPSAGSNSQTSGTNGNSQATTGGKTVYKVQVLSGTVKLAPNDKQLKGLKCERHQKGNRYIYTYGNASTLQEAKRIRNQIKDKFPQAFIVEF